MIQKTAAMGNWWLSASSQQLPSSCITSHAEFFGETSNYPHNSAHLQPRFSALWLLPFPQIKMTLEREEISDCSDHQWDSGKYDRAADGNWENCVRSQGAYFEGTWGVIVLSTMFLVSCIFFNNCLWFSYCIAGYILARLFYLILIKELVFEFLRKIWRLCLLGCSYVFLVYSISL